MPALCSFWSVSAEDAVLGPDVNNQSCGSSSFNVMAYLFTSFFPLIVYVYFLVSHSAINIQRWLTDLLFCRLSQVRNFPTVILVHTWVFLSCHFLCNLLSLLLHQVLFLFLHHFICISFLCVLLLLPLDCKP